MLALALLAVASCTEVHGGAVELSWTLRPESGDSVDLFVTCDPDVEGVNPIENMRLNWIVDGSAGSAAWGCSDYHGVTGFDVPAGSALLTVTPECATGDAAPGTYTAPAPIVRTVTVGQTVDLDAIEVFVEISDCGSGSGQQACICSGP